LGDSVYHVYAPYDLPDVLARFIRRIKPSLMLIMETELWPNTIAACAKRKIPTILINGRMSEKSARGYERFSGLAVPMLRSLTKGLVQNRADAARFQRIGLPADNTEVTGNIKFDLTLNDDLRRNAAHLKEEWSEQGKHVLWIAASTHPGEDEIILDAFAQLRKSLTADQVRLVLVPRHPERFNNVAALCANRGYVVSRRSENSVSPETDIILGDTMGELLLMFGASDIAFVGGSLVPNGGHNFIEPAAWALPLLSGLHVFNFAEVAGLLKAANALQLVSDSELAAAVEVLVKDNYERERKGTAALQVANENRGALEKTLKIIEQFL
jgi:3-deoxy-D-manno-octulosonic-acid transferase